jgi:hypothetical protein
MFEDVDKLVYKDAAISMYANADTKKATEYINERKLGLFVVFLVKTHLSSYYGIYSCGEEYIKLFYKSEHLLKLYEHIDSLCLTREFFGNIFDENN